MATTHPRTVLRRLRDFVTAEGVRATPDRQLLARFARGREEAAFEALVRRHGPLVLGVCRRVLHQEQDAEDVFQATFLVLARKADVAGRRASLGTWLYQVAYHMALKARKHAAARRRREMRSARPEATDPLAELTGRELLAVFDEELQALPEPERQSLVLCYLEGKTRDEAAREVGCSESTLKRRLERGKERMRLRLARRGVALPNALLAAGLTQGGRTAVPAALTGSTLRAGLLTANGQAVAGVVSAEAAALAAGAVRALAAGKARAVGALLVVAAVLGMAAALLASGPPAAAEKPEAKPAAVEARPADDGNKVTVTGRVLDADGKPLAGAEVAVMARPRVPHRGGDLSSGKPEVLGRGRADAQGRFRLTVPRTSSARFQSVTLVAGAAEYGLGWHDLDADAEKPAADIRLTREQVIRGRFVDLQGQPAAGVTVRVSAIGKRLEGTYKGVRAPAEPGDLPSWPKPAVTDRSGSFELRGVGRDVLASLAVSDDRFATQGFEVATDAGDGVKEYKAPPLEPAHIIEGSVSYADSGKPVPNARLTVYAARSEADSWGGMDARADDQGRFRINPLPGNFFQVSAYAPDGEPYLTVEKRLTWPRAAVKQQVRLTLPRGVLVRGKVTEGGSDKALAKATVQFIPRRADNPNLRKDVLTGWENTVVSGDDGRFDICVLPGPGHLLIHGPTPDYVYTEVPEAKLLQGKEGGRRFYAHAIVPLDLKPGADAHEVSAVLRPAVTVKGRVIGPDGKPAAEALMLSRLHVSALSSEWLWEPLPVREGRFELHGCDPAKTYPVCFLDARHRTGAMVELSGKQAGEEVTVRLLPCGEATTRLLDGDGKPLAKHSLWLELVVTPGASRYDLKKLYEKGELAADSEYLVNIDRLNYGKGAFTDAEGRVTFPALVPGATYWIVEIGDRDDMVKCQFKAESGKTVRLPDVVRKKP
jgi:RNA polymerase sigma factor (sigma-70 family)